MKIFSQDNLIAQFKAMPIQRNNSNIVYGLALVYFISLYNFIGETIWQVYFACIFLQLFGLIWIFLIIKYDALPKIRPMVNEICERKKDPKEFYYSAVVGIFNYLLSFAVPIIIRLTSRST